MDLKMDLDIRYLQMAMLMKVNIIKTNSMGKVNMCGKMELVMLEIFNRVIEKEKVNGFHKYQIYLYYKINR